MHHKKEFTVENEVEAERTRRNDEEATKKRERLLKEMWSFSWVTDPKYAPKEGGS